MKIKNLVLVLGLGLSLASCGHKQTRFAHGEGMGSNAEGEKNVTAQVEWVKNKKAEVHVNVRLTNNYDSSVTINTSEASLEFGGVKVAPKNRDEIRISSGVRSQMVYIFDFGKGKPEEGPADLTITPYSNDDVALAPIKIHLNIK